MARNTGRYELAQASRKKSETIEWNVLLLRAVRNRYGGSSKTVLNSPFTLESKEVFLKRLFSDAQNINPREPEEISKNIVDVNEKIYINTDGCEDETTVKVVNSVENSQGHNYQETTTKGIQWGVDANIGLQFGLPQVSGGGSGGVGFSYQQSQVHTVTHEKTKKQKVEQQAHHEEMLKIPPGKKAIVTMTSYRVRYKLDYTMEYKIPKSEGVQVRLNTFGLGLCFRMGFVTASEIMHPLPGYREDEEFVYMCQEGELRWIADRMVVKKRLVDV